MFSFLSCWNLKPPLAGSSVAHKASETGSSCVLRDADSSESSSRGVLGVLGSQTGWLLHMVTRRNTKPSATVTTTELPA